MNEVEALLLKPEDAAKLLGLGRSKVYRMIQNGELPCVRLGTMVRVPVEGLREWIREHTEQRAHTMKPAQQK